jgi:hypothetical protein
MKIYAETPGFRSRQVLADVAIAVWVFLWVRIGLRVKELVDALGAPGRTIEDAGSGFTETLLSAAREVGDVPVVGEALQAPLESAAGAGRVLQRAGATQQEVVHNLALWLGILLALIPILVALAHWLPWRVRWAREASAANRLKIDSDDLQLFALRAIANRPLDQLRRATPDPAAAFARGDYGPLAALELKELGLRTS